MKDKAFLQEIETIFYAYYQKKIEELREDHPQYGEMTNAALINIQDDFVTAEIKRRNVYFTWEKLTSVQRDVYDKALAQQIYYVLTEGDFAAMSGYDIVTNTFAPQEELAKRALSPAARQTLAGAGLFYSGLGAPSRHHFRGW